MDPQLLSAFVAGCAYLFLKMFANSGVQAYGRFRYKSHKYPEDQAFFGVPPDRQLQPELLLRAEACWRNDLENIPLFWVAALCGLLTGVASPLYHGLILVFCAARTLHTLALLGGWQPWRFLAYATGVGCTASLYLLSLRQLGW